MKVNNAVNTMSCNAIKAAILEIANTLELEYVDAAEAFKIARRHILNQNNKDVMESENERP